MLFFSFGDSKSRMVQHGENTEAEASCSIIFVQKHAQDVKCEHMELAGIVSSQICAFLSVTSVQTSRVELVDKQFINPCTLNKEHMLLKSKNTVSITSTFDQTCRTGTIEPFFHIRFNINCITYFKIFEQFLIVIELNQLLPLGAIFVRNSLTLK